MYYFKIKPLINMMIPIKKYYKILYGPQVVECVSVEAIRSNPYLNTFRSHVEQLTLNAGPSEIQQGAEMLMIAVKIVPRSIKINNRIKGT
jgi:hypothetical protein